MKPRMRLLVLAAVCGATLGGAKGDIPAMESASPTAWPDLRKEHKPWTRWWWMGSAVEKGEIARHLEAYRDAGLGGVEISPIYGVKGREDRFLPYLSPAWMDALDYTVAEAGRLGLGVDMIEGTGWPFGGPGVTPEDAAASVVLAEYSLERGQQLPSAVRHIDKRLNRDSLLQAVMAFSDGGDVLDLTSRVAADGQLDWKAPKGTWTLYAVFRSWTGQKVKRAAPGGEGWVVDHFSGRARERYLKRFDEAFGERRGVVRCFFNDSYEAFGADWTDGLFEEFGARRGYDLRRHLPELLGKGPADRVARVKCDYRETISDLLLERFIRPWTEWTHARGSLSRNQAHGSPGNLLDLYAAADIPETETFGAAVEPLLYKFASSAAHASGKPLASSESFTWLREHFQGSLADVKAPLDALFLSGINHVFYHGMTYSPAWEDWPGWLFYAATHFGMNGGLWRDLPALNAYIARCQSVLQSGRPDNDVLLYFPVHDVWHAPEGMSIPFRCHNLDEWLHPTAFGETADALSQAGYGIDFVSDRLLAQARATDESGTGVSPVILPMKEHGLEARATSGGISLGGVEYRVLVVPRCAHIPVETLETIKTLAARGATVAFQGGLPSDVPGLGRLEERRSRLKDLLSGIRSSDGGEMAETPTGKGRILVGDDLPAMLAATPARREPMTSQGIRFIRRRHDEGFHYFLVNDREEAFDGWIALGTPDQSVVLLDPLSGRTGMASVRKGPDGATQVYLQLCPGGSLILRTFWVDSVDEVDGVDTVDGERWLYFVGSGRAQELRGKWRVDFIEGGSELPAGYSTDRLKSWTGRDDAGRRFCGTARYTLSFDCAKIEADEWTLDLGRVCESARVTLNGRPVGTLWCAPFRVRVGEYLREGENQLEIEVTNLAANRIADVDRRGVAWKKFYDINMARLGQPGLFDASGWNPRDSGLLGPVRLTPQRKTGTTNLH